MRRVKRSFSKPLDPRWKLFRRAQGLKITRRAQEGDRFPETLDPDKHRARYAALRRRRAANKVARRSRKRNRR